MGWALSAHASFIATVSGEGNTMILVEFPAVFYLFKHTTRTDQMFLSYCGLSSLRALTRKSCHRILRNFLAIAR